MNNGVEVGNVWATDINADTVGTYHYRKKLQSNAGQNEEKMLAHLIQVVSRIELRHPEIDKTNIEKNPFQHFETNIFDKFYEIIWFRNSKSFRL